MVCVCVYLLYYAHQCINFNNLFEKMFQLPTLGYVVDCAS